MFFRTSIGSNGFACDVTFHVDADCEFAFFPRNAAGEDLTVEQVATLAGVTADDVDELFQLRAEEATQEDDGDDYEHFGPAADLESGFDPYAGAYSNDC